MLTISWKLALFGATALLLASTLGRFHPIGDSLAVFRLWLVVPVLMGAMFLRGRLSFIIGFVGGAGLVSLAAMLPLTSLPESGRSLYQKNLLFSNPDPAAVGREILERQPDFVTLQEVSGANFIILETLRPELPAQQYCDFSGVGGVAVVSRWPAILDSGFCAERDGLAAMQVQTPDGPVWLVSIHQHWPWPHGQAHQAARHRVLLEALDGPKVIGGDFNMVPWSHRMRDIAQASETQRIGTAFVTLIKARGLLRASIDHVLVTGGQGATQRLPLLGSDHYGLFARFSLPVSTP